MKLKYLHDISPVHLYPGDKLTLNHCETFHDGMGNVVEKRNRVLLEERLFTEEATIDRVGVVELEDGELSLLGLKKGFAAVLGEKL